MASITYVKLMKREELINMLEELHRFEMITRDGRHLICDKRINEQKPKYEDFYGTIICNRAPAFKLSAFDICDCLVVGEGYVRYSSFKYGKGDTTQGNILIHRYGFERED